MSAPTTHDPLVVNTQDGAVWVRRAVTREGRGLYAVADAPACCPEFVMATLAELAEHGLASMAFALPMPAGDEPVVRPLALAEAQIEALAAAGNRVVNDEQHQHLCMCDAWPERCVSTGNYFMGAWDVSGLEAAIPAVLGLWESMRGSELVKLQARVAELEAMEQRLLAALPTEPRQTYGLPNDLAATAAEWGAWEQVAEVLGVQLPYEHPVAEADVTPQVTKLRALLAGQRAAVEDPHDGPLHHSYRVGRDLPELGGAL